MQRLRQLRWELGSVLPAHIKDNLCELEVKNFFGPSKLLSANTDYLLYSYES